MRASFVVVTLLLAVGSSGCPAHSDSGAGEQVSATSTTPPNPVQREMRTLTSALELSVRAIGAGDLRGVEHELHKVDEAREATEAALHSGAYRLPKNADRIEEFARRDEAFHRDLEHFAQACRDNDVAAAAEALGPVLRGCPTCHTDFRR